MFKLALLIVLLATAHVLAQPSLVTPTTNDPDSEIRAVGALRGGITTTKAHTGCDTDDDPCGTDSGIGWVLGLEIGWGTKRLMGVGYLDVAQVQVGTGASSQHLTEIGVGMRFHRQLIGGLYAGLGLGTESFSDSSGLVYGLASMVDVHASYRFPGKLGVQLFLIGQSGFAPEIDSPAGALPANWLVSARAEIGLAF